MSATLRRWGSLVALMTLAGAGVVTSVSAQVAGMAAANLQQVSGTITAIDPQRGALKLRVEPSGGQPASATEPPTMFVVDTQTVISQAGETLRLTDLRVGDAVKIEYAAEAGKHVARAIALEAPRSPEGR